MGGRPRDLPADGLLTGMVPSAPIRYGFDAATSDGMIRSWLARLFPAELSDQVQFGIVLAWLLAAGGIIGLAALIAAWVKGWIDGLGFVVGLLMLPIVLYAAARAVFASAGGASRAFVGTVFASGNLEPDASFSAEEAMVMQGRIDEARIVLEARLAADPDDVAVRLHLAALVRDHQQDHAEAERLYVEGRARPQAGGRADTFANLLIDLYQQSGNRGRLMAEYARYAERHAGTAAGEAAKRRLMELKTDALADRPTDTPPG